jgi:hypothetical protein
MGSWSESCGFSGLEIAHGDPALVMLLEQKPQESGPYNLYGPRTTLIRGTYNDYGSLEIDDLPEITEIFNKQSGLTLTQGIDFDTDMLNGLELDRFWIHGEIFDRLILLKKDFPYTWISGQSVKVSTIGESIDLHGFENLKSFKQAVAEIQVDGNDDLSAVLRQLRRLTGRGFAGGYDTLSQFYQQAYDDLADKAGDSTALFEAKRRNDVLASAAGELRKKIVPSEGVGPQHAGHIASVQFAKFILEIQDLRTKDRFDEEEEDES